MKKFVAVISPDASLQTQLRFLFSQFFLSSLISLFLYILFLSFVYFISLCAAISSSILSLYSSILFLYFFPLFPLVLYLYCKPLLTRISSSSYYIFFLHFVLIFCFHLSRFPPLCFRCILQIPP